MKTIKTRLRPISCLLAFLMLLQSCVTLYNATPVTLSEAAKSNLPVKIEQNNGKKLRLLTLEKLPDGTYYGTKKAPFGVRRVPLNENFVKKVQIKDKQNSAIASGALAATTAVVLLVSAKSGMEKNLKLYGN